MVTSPVSLLAVELLQASKPRRVGIGAALEHPNTKQTNVANFQRTMLRAAPALY